MRISKTLLGCSLLFALAAPAIAHEAGAGETCQAVQHNVSHTINNKKYSCDATSCTKCDASGSAINNCVKTTYYENCVAAASTMPNKPVVSTVGVKLPPTQPSRFGASAPISAPIRIR